MQLLVIFVIVCVIFSSIVNAWSVPVPSKWLKKVVAAGLAAELSILGPGFTSSIPNAVADAIPIVGADAPTFSLPSNAGKRITLDDLKGKYSVLYFYPVHSLIISSLNLPLMSYIFFDRAILLKDALLKLKVSRRIFK